MANMGQVPFRPCVIIPVYNHSLGLADLVKKITGESLPVILVDDGSDAACAAELDRIAAREEYVTLLRHAKNGGKGAAVCTGLTGADNAGFTHALQVDADGQHDIGVLPAFLNTAQENPGALVCGYPDFDETAPQLRKGGRKFGNWWARLLAYPMEIRDALCGFRVYPVASLLEIIKSSPVAARMEFDPQILIYCAWNGIPFVNLPVKVTYPKDGISHFRAFRDNVLISLMYTKMCLRRLGRFFLKV